MIRLTLRCIDIHMTLILTMAVSREKNAILSLAVQDSVCVRNTFGEMDSLKPYC